MALLFMDSFDHYVTADITEKWTQIVAPVVGQDTDPVIGAYGRNSTQGMRCAQSNTDGLHHTAPVGVTVAASGATCVAGVACKYGGTASFNTFGVEVNPEESSYDFSNAGSNYIISIRDTNTTQVWFRVNTNGTISALRGTAYASTVLGTTSSSLQVDVWAYVEVKVVIDDTVGTVEVRINGTPGLTLTGQDTKQSSNAAWNEVRFGYASKSSGTVTIDLDDVYICDGSGSLNNDFLGDVTISALYASGAGNTTGWTASAGSNYQCVDEATPNDDTDYVSTSTVDAKDTYAFTDCAAGATIKAVQLLSAVRKGAEGPGKIKHVVRSNSTDYDSAEMGIGGTSYSYCRTVHETDPATGVAWTESGFNGAEFGVKKTG